MAQTTTETKQSSRGRLSKAGEDIIIDSLQRVIFQYIRENTDCKEINYDKGIIEFVIDEGRYQVKVIKK